MTKKTILENIKFILELDNNEVITVSNGKEALEIFKNNYSNIDVVITDMKMPEISGMEILKEIKK